MRRVAASINLKSVGLWVESIKSTQTGGVLFEMVTIKEAELFATQINAFADNEAGLT